MSLDRRSFLKGALAAGTLAAGGALAATPAVAGPVVGPDSADLFKPEDYQKKWAFEIPPDPIPDSQITEVIDADLVVVGCGTSGLLTAMSAQAHGLNNVVIVTASVEAVSRGGSNNTIFSKYMAEQGMEKIPVKYYQKEISQMYNNCNQSFWYKYYNNSEEAMNFLIDIMVPKGFYVGMELSANIPEDDLYFQPFSSHAFLDGETYQTPGTAQPLLVHTLADEFEARGGKIFYQNKAQQLVRDNNNTGRVSAVIAQNLENDAFVKFNASKAVVLATGDFSKNRDMCYKYVPAFAPRLEEMGAFDTPTDYDKPLGGTPGLMNGDGHMMGIWVGAGWQRNNPNTLMGSTYGAGPSGTYTQGFPGLIVNRNGKRFMNEFASARMQGMTMLHTPGQQVFGIWDKTYAEYPGMWRDTWDSKSGNTPPENVLAGWVSRGESGSLFMADTIEELIAKMELPADVTKATIDRYNEMCDAGVDTDFYKRSEGLNAIKQAPFFAQRSGGRDFLTILGGLRTNDDLQVCEDDDTPIEGLYNVGTMTGDMFGGVYTFQIQGACYGAACVTLGYWLGKSIASA